MPEQGPGLRIDDEDRIADTVRARREIVLCRIVATADDEDFADAALAAGIDYQTLIRRILNLALRYRATWD